MTPVTIASLRTNTTFRVLAALQVASAAMQMGHQVFPKARLLAVSTVIDAFTILFSPSALELADVHQGVATSLLEQHTDQARRSSDLASPFPEREDIPFRTSSG